MDSVCDLLASRARGSGATFYSPGGPSDQPPPSSQQPAQPALVPRVLSKWPIEDGLNGPQLNPAYEFGKDQLEDLRYLYSLIYGTFTGPMIEAENALAYSSDTARVQQAAENLATYVAQAQDALVNIVKGLLSAAGRGLQEASSGFAQIGGEMSAWGPAGVPLPIQEDVKRFAFQWRDVTQAASNRFYTAERVYSDIMIYLTNASTLVLRLWQLQSAINQEKIGRLTAQVQALQAARATLREAADAFVKIVQEGTAAAEKALKTVGNTLGLGAVGPIVAIGAVLLALLYAFSKGAFRR